MFKWKSPVEINSHVRKSAVWREYPGNRLNWRQAPLARASCALRRLSSSSTAWIVNATRAALSGACLHPHLLPVGKEVGQRILRYNRRICRGSPIRGWHRCCQHRLRPNSLEHRRHQEPAHKFAAL